MLKINFAKNAKGEAGKKVKLQLKSVFILILDKCKMYFYTFFYFSTLYPCLIPF